MDLKKCNDLKSRLGPDEYGQIVPIVEFFDGNDDSGSIGCNLLSHPGMDRFREVLTGLLNRPDVKAVFAAISELDPGEDSWPFTDTVLVVGTISSDDLHSLVSELQPDEIGDSAEFGISPLIAQQHRSPVLVVWWD